MRKLMIYLLLLSMLLSLVACGGGGGGTETTTDTESESTTESQEQPHPLIGMSEQEVCSRYPKHFRGGCDAMFFEDEQKKSVIAEFEWRQGQSYVVNVTIYDKVSEPTDVDFLKIAKGMTMDRVIELVGIPYSDGPETSSTPVFCYRSKEGTEYVLHLTNTVAGSVTWKTEVVHLVLAYYATYSTLPLLPTTQVLASEIVSGMEKESIVELVSVDKCIDWGNYLLFRDKEGQSVIVTMDENDKAIDITAYAPPAEIPTSEDVNALQGTGATIFDYTEAFGLPYYVDYGWDMGLIYLMTDTGSVCIGDKKGSEITMK